MKKIKYFFTLSLLFPISFSYALENLEKASSKENFIPKNFWRGHQIHVDAGVFTVINSSKPRFKIGPMIEAGYQYGFLFSQWYLGLDAMFTIFIPDSFEEQNIHLGNAHIPAGLLALIPIFHVYFGYSFKNNILFTIGSAYGWGLITTLGVPVSKSGFVEMRLVWWLDKFITGNVGLHDAYLTVGGGIKF